MPTPQPGISVVGKEGLVRCPACGRARHPEACSSCRVRRPRAALVPKAADWTSTVGPEAEPVAAAAAAGVAGAWTSTALLPCLALHCLTLPCLASPTRLLWMTGSSRRKTCWAGMAGAGSGGGGAERALTCLLCSSRCPHVPEVPLSQCLPNLRSSLVGSDSLEYDGDVRAQLHASIPHPFLLDTAYTSFPSWLVAFPHCMTPPREGRGREISLGWALGRDEGSACNQNRGTEHTDPVV